MVKLLINSIDAREIGETSFGGKPVKNIGEEFHWPVCKCCNLPMQFLGKLAEDNILLQIFMCQNDPGMCEDWDANEGGNAVIVTTPLQLEYVNIPTEGIPLRDTEYWSSVENYQSDDYNEARIKWAEQNDVSPRHVLGQISGQPSWIQGDETPLCSHCKETMSFVAQLEQGPDWKIEMNFGGGGVAYLFRCDCKNTAKFLWQC